MRKFFSYIRVSTLRQGQTGTSLVEQQAAIERYAQQGNFRIVKQFEERETAAKSGRPVFNQMLKCIKQGQAEGVLMHKIDRSARNLRDWADLGDLIDHGIQVHFVNEGLDLFSRGGRLSADIQAVIASDFIRNLREETRKGFYGRIKQGLYPRPAPLGYLNMGKGKPKALDPIRAPLIRRAFEMYATGDWGLDALVDKLYEIGLRNRSGNKVVRNGLSSILHNVFYIGLIRLKEKGEIFNGIHQTLISKTLFDQVQDVLSGKNVKKVKHHMFQFRGKISCGNCQKKPSGETRKGHVYYRCHTKDCEQRSFREEEVENIVEGFLGKLAFNNEEKTSFEQYIKAESDNIIDSTETQKKTLKMQLEQLKERLSKLTDGYLDRVIDEVSYLEKKNSFILEQKSIEEKLAKLNGDGKEVLTEAIEFFRLVNNAYLSYKTGNMEEKRDMVKIVFSDLQMNGEKLLVKPNLPFSIVAERSSIPSGSPQLAAYPTWMKWAIEYFKNTHL
ncbi:MAG: recombinase family protein [Acidobacteria bacterium]|nr:recombinase family protein [Acidobacteriota bacterium]